ncbi:hypothetical protein NR224_08680, partial [Pediococcus ethanolidurans]
TIYLISTTKLKNIRASRWIKACNVNQLLCYTVSAHMNKDSYVELYDDIKQPLACGAKAAIFY